MKIWCCLCFGEEEEEYKKRETMGERKGILGNLDFDEGKSEEIRHDEELGSGKPRDEDDGGKFRLQPGEGTSRGSNVDVNLNLSLGGDPSSSSAAAVLERDGLDRDSHSKRPKVHSLAL